MQSEKQELGFSLEKEAINILENLGYKLLKHTSLNEIFSRYDLVVEKDNIVFYVEVKGRSDNLENFVINKEQMEFHKFIKNSLFIFLNENKDFLLFDINGKICGNGNFNVYWGMQLDELKVLKEKINFELNNGKEQERFIVRKIGSFYGFLFSKEMERVYNLSEGDIIRLCDDFLIKRGTR